MRIFLIILTLCLAISSGQFAFARSEQIVAVVNDDAISLSDLNNRLKLIAASSGLPQTPEIYQKLSGQVIGSLIDEQIMLQEARRLELEISPEELENGFAAIAQQNNFTAEQFRIMLQKGGLSVMTMHRQVESQIAWSKIIQSQLRPKVSISDNDVDNVLKRLKNSKGRMEYLLAEIFLPVDSPRNESDARQLAQKLKLQIKTGQAPFFKLAQQFSKAAGSSQGGGIGWVQAEQLSEELLKALKTIKKGEVSNPVRSLSGYHILLLRDVRQISDETIPSRKDIKNVLGTQRLERMQRRHLLDLKAAAFIENRVNS
ncbi:MAG: peptidylprolyl isomerase [Alphaproteobacteria bacterium]|nr:peptidylprolyl isomerase [Alphaproteobacteria bacterium]